MSDYTLHCGDALTVLRTLPSNSVHCCVTSPPYFGLRDYGTATWEGGDAGCDHRKVQDAAKAVATSTLGGGKKTTGHLQEGYGGECPRCGARRIDQQIGLEETPEAYVARLVEVFREVKRVLHSSGVLWLNLGDSYASNTKGSGGVSHSASFHATAESGRSANGVVSAQRYDPRRINHGVKEKDLIGIPWMVAFALRADGWWLRQEIIWHKLAPMPESVTDRCTKAHEQVFMLAKSERYFFDQDAIREENAGVMPYGDKRNFKMNNEAAQGRHGKNSMFGGGTREEYIERYYTNGRNKRSVWTLGPESYSGAHYAVMPTKLVEPCVLAGSSAKGCCSKCLAPWERIVEKEMPPLRKVTTNGPVGGHGLLGGNRFDEPIKTTTLGWQPTCTCVESPEKLYWCPDCDIRAEISQLTQGCPKCGETMIPAPYPVIPCTILDPFFGSGTVGAVALKHGRRFVGIDLDARNIELAQRRIEQSQPMLLEVTP